MLKPKASLLTAAGGQALNGLSASDWADWAQDRADIVARKQVRFLETGHDDIVAMIHNELIHEGRFVEGTKLAGDTSLLTFVGGTSKSDTCLNLLLRRRRLDPELPKSYSVLLRLEKPLGFADPVCIQHQSAVLGFISHLRPVTSSQGLVTGNVSKRLPHISTDRAVGHVQLR